MKKVVTMVGTSIFENYMKSGNVSPEFLRSYDPLKEKRASKWDSEKDRCERIKSIIIRFARGRKIYDLSAEIKSLIKIKNEFKCELEIYLLCSDTIISKLAGEIIREIISEAEEFRDSRIDLKTINGLQVWNRSEFNLGMSNLIVEIYKIAGGYWNNVIINITGGYKAIVPYLTILAQINRCPIYYIFEETEEMMGIPYVPLSMNWQVFEKNEDFLFKLERTGVLEIKDKNKIDPDIESLLEFAGNLCSLNPLGVALWERYRSNFEFIYISSECEKYISRDDERRRIFLKSIIELKRRLRENPGDPDLHHTLKGVDLPEGFRTFKHKEENRQVRILYKDERYQTRYGYSELLLYVGLIAIGSDVHNADSEYVSFFERSGKKVINTEEYKLIKINKMEERDV